MHTQLSTYKEDAVVDGDCIADHEVRRSEVVAGMDVSEANMLSGVCFGTRPLRKKLPVLFVEQVLAHGRVWG